MNMFYIKRNFNNIMIVNLDAIKCLFKEDGRYFILFGEFRNEITKEDFEKIEEHLKINGGLK